MLWLQVKRVLYECMESARLLYEDITAYLIKYMVFTVIVYDIWLANKIIGRE